MGCKARYGVQDKVWGARQGMGCKARYGVQGKVWGEARHGRSSAKKAVCTKSSKYYKGSLLRLPINQKDNVVSVLTFFEVIIYFLF